MSARVWHCPAWCTVPSERHQEQLMTSGDGERYVVHSAAFPNGTTDAMEVWVDQGEAVDPGALCWDTAINIGVGGTEYVPASVRRIVDSLEAALEVVDGRPR